MGTRKNVVKGNEQEIELYMAMSDLSIIIINKDDRSISEDIKYLLERLTFVTTSTLFGQLISSIRATSTLDDGNIVLTHMIKRRFKGAMSNTELLKKLMIVKDEFAKLETEILNNRYKKIPDTYRTESYWNDIVKSCKSLFVGIEAKNVEVVYTLNDDLQIIIEDRYDLHDNSISRAFKINVAIVDSLNMISLGHDVESVIDAVLVYEKMTNVISLYGNVIDIISDYNINNSNIIHDATVKLKTRFKDRHIIVPLDESIKTLKTRLGWFIEDKFL